MHSLWQWTALDLITELLNNACLYVLFIEFQGDPTEEEFGIYQQQSGENFYISVDQVLPSLRLQHLKLFTKLSSDPANIRESESCCKTSLDETKPDCLDNYFEMSSKLTESKKSTFYYICEYITHKKGLVTSEDVALDNIKESETTRLVSSG